MEKSEVTIGITPDNLPGTKFALSVCDRDNLDKRIALNLAISNDTGSVYETISRDDIVAIVGFLTEFNADLDERIKDAKCKRLIKIESEILALQKQREEILASIGSN